MKQNKKRFLSAILTMSMVACTLVVGQITVDAAATIQEGMPASPKLGTSANPTQIGFGGETWDVIGNNGSGVASSTAEATLLQAQSPTSTQSVFDTNGLSHDYDGSDLKTAMENQYNSLEAAEKALVNPRDLDGGSDFQGVLGYDADKIAGANVTGVYFWPLSVQEANSLHSSVLEFADDWWLRSPGDDTDTAAYVADDGTVNDIGQDVDTNISVRPAFKLDLTSVIFTSAAVGGKSVTLGDLEAVVMPTTEVLKLTVLDSDTTNVDLTDASVTKSTIKAGDTVEVVFEGAVEGTDKYVSAVLVNSDDEIVYYIQLSRDEDGSGEFTVPDASDLPDGEYTLQVFNEQVNNDYFTDFASTPIDIVLTVDNDAPAVKTVSPEGSDVPITGNIVITFNKAMKTSVGVVEIDGKPVTGSWSAGDTVYTIAYSAFQYEKVYTLDIKDFEDSIGNPMTPYTQSKFTTVKDTTPVDPITAFTIRLYDGVFQRKPDAGGLAYWVNGFVDESISATDAAYFFFLSPEMESLKLSDGEYVERLYTVLMGRTFDPAGKTFWLDYMDKGVSRIGVLRQFLGSPEFNRMCAAAGIELGTIPVANEARDANPHLTAFLHRLYGTVLGRNIDIGGLNFWAGRYLYENWNTASIAREFFFSQEVVDKNWSDTEFVRVLYRTFFDRTPEPTGNAFWLNELTNGQSREYVLNFFAYSEEFAEITQGFFS